MSKVETSQSPGLSGIQETGKLMAALQKGKDFSNLCAVLAVQALWNYFVILEPISLRKLEL